MNSFKKPYSCFLGALCLLAFNLFVMSPYISRRFGDLVGNGTYVGLRMLTIMGFSFLMSYLFESKRLPVIRSTTFLVFVDQVILKGFFLWNESRISPQAWEGMDYPSTVFALLVSYVISIPLIVIVAFAGTELKDLLSQKNKARVQI
jgi:hypothetical protein